MCECRGRRDAQERPRAKKSYLPWVSHPQVAFQIIAAGDSNKALSRVGSWRIGATLQTASLTGNYWVRSRYRPCFLLARVRDEPKILMGLVPVGPHADIHDER